jgi:hypothetical protein
MSIGALTFWPFVGTIEVLDILLYQASRAWGTRNEPTRAIVILVRLLVSSRGLIYYAPCKSKLGVR